MAIDQATRLLNVFTPLGENAVALTSFSGQEGLSQLFRFQLELISDNNALTPTDLVGKNVTFSVARKDDSPRFFNGFVNRFHAGDENVGGRRDYRVEVVPWLWFLTRTTDCRIFQHKSSVEIIEQVFQDLGFSDYELAVKGNHPKREYCVQYRETDFGFVSRLLEEEGMFYFFVHEEDKHILKIADAKSAYIDCLEKDVDYPKLRGSATAEDHILSWAHRYEFRTGKIAQTDYNFKIPSTSLMTNEQTVVKLPGVDKYEYYDYPGLYANPGDGQALAKVRMEEEEAGHEVVEATGLCKTFTPGGKFKIREHVSESEEGKKYVITSIQHVAHEPLAYETGASQGPEYQNKFTCIPESVTFRPPRVTNKPFVRGPQTAVVTGPPGEEIYPDEFGRVKIQFPWDREGKKDENSSCWVRVSQVHAGKGFGGIDIPRIGEEVVVDFLEGDPDQPIIIGRVYHAENMPPFGLPAAKNVSGLKSNSTKGGGGYNEMVMDDTKGQEEVRIHAQYNMNTTVENDQTTTVHNNRTDTIDVDDSETVGANQTISIGSNQALSVGADRTVDVAANQTTTIGGNKDLSVSGNRGASVSGNDELGVSGSQKIGVDGPIEISSSTSITLTVADSTIKIEPGKISISSGGTVLTEGTAKVECKGAMISSQASGNHEIMGALVKIN